MKFIDGFWLLKDGVKPSYALQVTEAQREESGYNLQVATKPIRHRGDTLAGPVFRIRVHSPTEGVVGVKMDHFAHSEPYPVIPLFPDVPAIPNVSLSKVSESPDSDLQLSTGGLSAVITRNPYTITFKSPKRTLTSAGYKHQAVVDVPYRWTINSAANSSCLNLDASSNPAPAAPPRTVRYMHSELNISPGELIYGFGEQFGSFIKNGQSIKVWNQDGGTSSDQAYKCVPFYLTSRGYGVFINHPGEVEVEVGSEKVSRTAISVADNTLEYFIIYGETPLEILERYTRMTGRPALLPAWSFGLWLSTSFLTDYSAETVSGFLQGMKERECYVRVFHLDCFWMKGHQWCSFTFDPDNFPDPKKYLTEIKDKYGVQICVWINPYISQLSPIFDEGAKGGYFIKRTDSSPWQWDLWQPGLAIVDVTNPDARKWYLDKLEALIDLGVDAFKTDFGERIPHANVVFHDGSDPMRMHNSYSVIYNEMVFRLLERRMGKGEAILFARSAAAGGQRFPVHWGGDCESNWEAMHQTIRGCLSLTSSGFAFASHDIGGFEYTPTNEIYQRWVAFGLFSSHSRLHGSASYRVPWVYSEDAAKTMAKFVEAKHRLMPYIYNLAVKAHLNGHPLQRAMFIEYPNDKTAQFLDQQFMLGSSLLVAPVFVPEGEESEYYLPEGVWTSFFHSEKTVKGPKWVKEVVPIDEIPLYVRESSVLCLGPNLGKPDYDFAQGLEVRLYELGDRQKVETEIPGTKNAEIVGSVNASREKDKVMVTASSAVDLSSVMLIGGSGLSSVQGGTVDGQVIKVEKGSKEIIIHLGS